MTARNGVNMPSDLRTLLNVGAVGSSSDGQLLERFATGVGEARESAFAALVGRHGALVYRVCRSVLRDEDAAEDAFQATFLALARKAGSLWVRDSLAPWLHQAAYRAAAHDRSATIRRRSHERVAASLRPESTTTRLDDDLGDLRGILHEEVDRLPGRFRVAVVLCDLEGRTHEQAARHLGCAVGTVKSRLARGRKRLQGRLIRRGVACSAVAGASPFGSPASGSASASDSTTLRASVPAGLAELTVVRATTAGAVPPSIAILTEGALKSMFLTKIKGATTAAAAVLAIAAGAVAIAQSGAGKPKVGAAGPRNAGSPGYTYHLLVSRDGEAPRKVAVVELDGDSPIRVEAPGALVTFQPRPDAKDRRPKADPARPDDDPNPRKVAVTRPRAMDLDVTQDYVCQLHAWRRINVRSLWNGTIQEVHTREGQAVKKGDPLFTIAPRPEKARLDAEKAERDLALLERDNAKKLAERKVVAANELKLYEAKLARAQAKVDLAEFELASVTIRAPFDGLVDRLLEQAGANIKEGDDLTTLSDNSTMWAYFNVSEKRYLEFMAEARPQIDRFDLVLANGAKFPHPGKFGAIEAQIHNETGNIALRADFPNPEGLLRHGQSGTILIHRTLPNAIVIPARATFELNGKKFVYVVDKDDVAHRREVDVQVEVDDGYVIKKGVDARDRIVLEGVRQARDGDTLQYEYMAPENKFPPQE